MKHNLWVTPYARDEMHPGGEFPNQNPRIGEGLATWVKQNRPLEEADIVLWLVHSFLLKDNIDDNIFAWIIHFICACRSFITLFLGIDEYAVELISRS